MSAIDTLKRVAQMLPSESRERFLLMCTRFQNVPEDDEYLQILEAIGLMSLLWKEVPEQIKTIIEGASPVESTNYQHLEKCIREAVNQSIPSHEDLRSFSAQLENHETTLKRLSRSQSGQEANPKGQWKWFVSGVLVSLILTYLIQSGI